MAFVYVLKSLKDKKLYVGSTRQPIDKRIQRHNNGQVISTKSRIPFVLLYSESFDDYSSARKKEIYFKSGSGREHLNRILSNRTGTQSAYVCITHYGGPAVVIEDDAGGVAKNVK